MVTFKKVKTEHHILKEYHKYLQQIEKDPRIQRIIPGRVHRKQKKTSVMRLSYSYETSSGLKFKMNKGSTSQELFVICSPEETLSLKEYMLHTFEKYIA